MHQTTKASAPAFRKCDHKSKSWTGISQKMTTSQIQNSVDGNHVKDGKENSLGIDTETRYGQVHFHGITAFEARDSEVRPWGKHCE